MAKLLITVGAPICALALTGCATHLSYAVINDSDSVPSTALRFKLPDSKITLSTTGATADTSKTGGAAGTTDAVKSNCPTGTTDATWAACFSKAGAYAAMAPAASTDRLFLATPADGSIHLVTTAISGSNVSGQDTLYTSVTVKYTNNTAGVVTGAASGASAGFAFGPIGAAVGGLVGAGVVIAGPAPGSPLVANVGGSLADYVCANDAGLLDFAALATAAPALAPSLVLPVTINGPDARPFAPPSQLQTVTAAKGHPNNCWHALPNAAHLGELTPAILAPPTSGKVRAPTDGDGWLYRLVSSDDPTQMPPGSKAMDDYLKGIYSDFPYPVCRTVQLQIVWWKALSDAIGAAKGGQDPTPKVLSFPAIKIADPKYVKAADVKKGGVINFRLDCGATVSATPDTSTAGVINAAVGATESIYKSEQSWASSQAKK